MSSITVKAEQLSVGDVVLLPFGKTATVIKINPFGPGARYVRFNTQYGQTKLERNAEVQVEAKVL